VQLPSWFLINSRERELRLTIDSLLRLVLSVDDGEWRTYVYMYGYMIALNQRPFHYLYHRLVYQYPNIFDHIKWVHVRVDMYINRMKIMVESPMLFNRMAIS
jgi:hypothetical protein